MIQNPLTDTDYRKLQTALGHIAEAREMLLKAHNSGVDMSEALAVLDIQQHYIEGLKRAFFAERP